MDRSPSEPYTFDMIHQTNVSVDSSDIGLQPRWKAVLIEWAQLNGSVRELWLFGSRGPKGGATVASDVDIGLALMPANGDHDWALGNYAAMQEDWQAELEAMVQRHVSLVAMLPGNEGDREIRSTGVCLWKRVV
jgi:predicted nucleotidyltransferase